MTADEVIEVVHTLNEAGIKVWLDGGWGVDALIGEETRAHRDLDAVIELERSDDVIARLEPLGYQITLDHRPTRFVLGDAEGRRVDFHPIVLDGEGNGRQIAAGPNGGDAVYPAAGLLGSGTIGGKAVACLTPELLLLHHTGYKPQAKDRHNVRLLCERFGLIPPGVYA